ncbi:MAG TPA: hypothetical protein VHC98_00070 [Candidatus Saccharimonadales bacterium]|nr:hypothetical protein [Candidatus Saccharimonadales bacterium]
MAAVICPTITAQTPDEYRTQMERVTPFAGRLHLDAADGQLAPRHLLDLDKLWWPGNKMVDLHVMYRQPFQHTELFIAQHPNLVIVHAEAEGDFRSFADRLHRQGIEVGVALLPATDVRVIAPAIQKIDHVLIFSGNLGYQGGSRADLSLLTKVRELRRLKPGLEVGWDGGVSAENIRQLIVGGVDVLNVGGYIQHAVNPARAYATLEAAA